MNENLERKFLAAEEPHIVMVTNHGMHEWKIDAGLPDTGGQNVYVNQLSNTLGKLGFRVSIYNRGGYDHPRSGTMRRGTHYRNERERLSYLEDGRAEFIRKEDMGSQVDALAKDLQKHLKESPEPAALVSHYWDGAEITEIARRALGLEVPHVWIPHSLGALKREGTPPAQWKELRLEERIERETELLKKVDLVGATSEAMKRTLREEHRVENALFLPPCVNEERFNKDSAREDLSALELLGEATGRSTEDIGGRQIITEVSRTDRTKRKDVLIEAYARVAKRFPETILAITIDPSAGELYRELTALVSERGLSGQVAVLGSIWEYLPSLYGMTAVYCTPSIMEGFGMSIQEAAACGAPAVASRRVPFAVEYLRGTSWTTEGNLEIGDGAIIVPPDAVQDTAVALELLLGDEEKRSAMGEAAYRITIPRFTWDAVTRTFLEEAGITLPGSGSVAGE